MNSKQVASRTVISRCVILLIAAAPLAASTGCGWVQNIALDMTSEVLLEGSKAINEEPDPQMVRDSMPGNLKTVEVMLKANPGNLNLLYMLAQGFDAYTYLVVEDDIDLADAAGDTAKVRELRARASSLYARAQGYAAKLIRTKDTPSTEMRKTLETGTLDQVKAALAKLGKDDVPGLFWYTYGWTGRINVDQSNPERIAELPRVELLLGRILELDPGYFHGLPLVLSGSLYTSRGAMFGGDLPRGNALFERAVKASEGKFLLAKFTWARYYALQAQDKALFCRLLKEVVDAPTDLLPEQQMMNNVSQRWASRWMDRASSLFEDGQGCETPETGSTETKEADDELL